MSALLASIGFVVLAEMGDKTQLLAMALACRFRWHGAEGTVWNSFTCIISNSTIPPQGNAPRSFQEIKDFHGPNPI